MTSLTILCVCNSGEGIALEVDRFDPGRPLSGGSDLSPTTLIPGDVPIPSQVSKLVGLSLY